MAARVQDIHQRGTRAAQPLATAVSTGALYYVTDEGKTERSNGTTWDDVSDTAGSWTMVLKTSDEAKVSDAVLANDAALTIAMAANTKYLVRGTIFYDTVAAADLKWRHTGPTAPTLVRVKRCSIVPGATAFGNVAVDVAFSAADITELTAGTTGGYIEFEALVQNGANTGTFAFQWAQNTSTASATTVRAGSMLEYKVIA